MTRQELAQVFQNLQNRNLLLIDSILRQGSPAATAASWAALAWEEAYRRGILDGNNPGGAVSREMVAQIFYNANSNSSLNLPAHRMGTPDITDVSPWAQTAWIWAYQHGLLDGTDPRRNMTREMLATILMNANIVP